jgi:HEAT repeat protein
VSDSYLPDADLRIQALGRLIQTDANKVIPILGNIALESDNTGAARRAVFVLAQSRHPEAQTMVVTVAKRGAEPVRLAAVKELGRFGGANVSQELLQVYSTANMPIKHQVVLSLGQRADTKALLKIAQSERDAHLREAAIVTLGRAGGREQLRDMYATAPRPVRQAVIRGLFNARDGEGLIRIAEQESDPGLRGYVLERLRLMGTPAARAYLEKNR